MFFFILRRILISIPIFGASTFVVFGLVTVSGDPLFDLRQSTDPNRAQLMAARREQLKLDLPFPQRYVDWLAGVIPFELRADLLFIRWVGPDFGITRNNQDVYPLLREAVLTTFRLVVLATILSILLGLFVGIISAVRQYSAIDYSTTFVAFLCFSLPAFWVAVLLKEFGAIKANDFLEQPGFSPEVVGLLTVVAAAFWASVIGGAWRRRLIAGVIGGGAALVFLILIDATDWMNNPSISWPVLVLLAAGAGVLSAMVYAPLSIRPVMLSGLVSALVGLVGAVLFSGGAKPFGIPIVPDLADWITDPYWTQLLVLAVLALGTGAVIGLFAGGIDRRDAVKAGMTATTLVGILVLADRFMTAWSPTMHGANPIIGTVGPQTPNITGTFWERMLDYAGHQILPSLALMLIGFATFMRFTRASMLETLHSDYVRTAKAKGLPATQVIVRHGFRTALIPVMTVAALSFASVIEGAIITETVFGWQGTGRMFVEGLDEVDPYPVMGILVVVSISIVVMNMVADLMYAVLDPRIRR